MKAKSIKYVTGNRASYQIVFAEIKKMLVDRFPLSEHYFLRLAVNQSDCYYISCCIDEKHEELFAAVQIRHNGVFLHMGKVIDSFEFHTISGRLYNYLAKSANVFRFTVPLNKELLDELREMLCCLIRYQSSADSSLEC